MKFNNWTLFRSKETRAALRWCRYPFLLLGLLALGYYGFVILDAKAYQAYETWRFDQALKSAAASRGSPGSSNQVISATAPPGIANVGVGSRIMAGLDGAILGQIKISSIGLSVIILEGTNGRILRRGVGHIPGTALPGEPGNIGIAGHRDTFFRPLQNLHIDDEITLTTLNGIYSYRVKSTRLVEPDDMSVLNTSGDGVLTLVTCYPFYYVGPAPQRFIVRAVRIPGALKSTAMPEPTAQLSLTPNPE